MSDTTSFHVGGAEGTVDVLLHGRKTIDDVIVALQEALQCAEAKRDTPPPFGWTRP